MLAVNGSYWLEQLDCLLVASSAGERDAGMLEESKSHCTSTHKAFAGIPFSDALLARATHVAKLSVDVRGGTVQRHGDWETGVPGCHYRNNPPVPQHTMQLLFLIRWGKMRSRGL